MTIVEAIKNALADLGGPATYEDIYRAIIKGGYYNFGAANPQSVVRVQLKRHCDNSIIPSAGNNIKYFTSLGGRGREEIFNLLDSPVRKTDKVDVATKETEARGKKPSIFIKCANSVVGSIRNIDIPTHRKTIFECFWMLFGSFLPILSDLALRIWALDETFDIAFSDNVKGGEVFLLTSALITPFYYFLIKYIGSDAEVKNENKLPYFGLIFFISIVSFIAGLVAFVYYRIGRILVGNYLGDQHVNDMFRGDFGCLPLLVYCLSLLIWYYASYMNNRSTNGYSNIRNRQLNKLQRGFDKDLSHE